MHQCTGVVRVNFSKCTANGPNTLASATLVLERFGRIQHMTSLLHRSFMGCVVKVIDIIAAFPEQPAGKWIQENLEQGPNSLHAKFTLPRYQGLNYA